MPLPDRRSDVDAHAPCRAERPCGTVVPAGAAADDRRWAVLVADVVTAPLTAVPTDPSGATDR